MDDLKSTVVEISSTEKQLEIEIPREQFKSLYSQKVKKYSKELQLKGFRPGSIPGRVIEERFREPLTHETLEKLVEDTVKKVCSDHQLEPVAPGQVEELRNEGEMPIALKVKVEVDEVAEISDYQDLGVRMTIPEPVGDEDVERELERYRKSLAKQEPKEGPSIKGDIVEGIYLDIELEGQKQPLDEAKSFRVEVGSDTLAEFSSGFMGVVSGEEKTIEIDYPFDHPEKSLAGKKGRYTVKIEKVSSQQLTEINDEFVRRFRVETVEEFKDQLRGSLQDSRMQRARELAHHQAVEKLIDKVPFQVPKARVKRYIEAVHHHDEHDHHDHDHSQLETEATYQIKKMRLVQDIAAKEKIKPTQEEVNDKVQKLARQYGLEFETLKESLRKNGRINDIREELRMEKTLDYLIHFNS